jgi:predicted phosphoadenosine phosphosulfate sulfurtransferase
MAKEMKTFLEMNVLEVAKQRINWLIDNFDSIYVAFSGGKDSLVILELVDEVYKERGIKEKVKVIHRDEEFLPSSVVDFVDDHVKSGRFDFRYYCLQMADFRYVLGQRIGFVKWDERRDWIRPKPDYAISDPDNVYDQYTADQFTTSDGKGRKVIVTGVRAAESLNRLTAICNSPDTDPNRVQIAKNEKSGIELARPIYDWEEKDVFKYFMDKKLRYCQIYDDEVWSRHNLRVSSSTSVENCKRLTTLKKQDPVHFDQICQIFPDMRLQEKYWGEYDATGVIERYPKGWRGIHQYIQENLKGKQKKEATTRMHQAMKARENRLKKGLGKENFGGYPIRYVFGEIVKGNFKRPIAAKMKPTQKDIDHEL